MKYSGISLLLDSCTEAQIIERSFHGFEKNPFQVEWIVTGNKESPEVEELLRSYSHKYFIRNIRTPDGFPASRLQDFTCNKARYPFIMLLEQDLPVDQSFWNTLKEYTRMHLSSQQCLYTWDFDLKSFFPVQSAINCNHNEIQPEQKRILLCSHNLRRQGAQNSLLELATGLCMQKGYQVYIISPANGVLFRDYLQSEMGIMLFKKPHHQNTDIWSNEISRLADFLIRHKFEAVIANTLKNFYWIHVAEKAGIPCIFIPRESESPDTYFDYLPPWLRPLAYQTMEKASKVVFVADATRQQWAVRNKKNNFELIHNALRTERLESKSSGLDKQAARASMNIKPDEIVLLSVGTVSERKGQIDLIEALPDIFAKAKKNLKVFIIGCAPQGESTAIGRYMLQIDNILREYSEEIKSRIFLYPETDSLEHVSPMEFYQIADIFVFTSRVESYPRVILEAMYFGLPIVTTPCFGVKEQCVENINCYYYQEGDTSSLACKTLMLIEAEDLRRDMGQASSEIFNRMSAYPQMIDQYNQIIMAVMNES